MKQAKEEAPAPKAPKKAIPSSPLGGIASWTILASFASPSYRFFWFGSFFALTSFFTQILARGWLAQVLTGSPFLVALVTAVSFLPQLVLALPAGIVADRWDRRTIMIIAEGSSGLVALALALLVFTHTVTIWHLIVLSAVGGIGFAISLPARSAIVPDLVPPPLIPNAIALVSATFSTAQLIGPAVGGIAMGVWGAEWAFFGSAAAMGVALVFYLFVHQRPVQHPPHLPVFRSLAEGFQHVWHTPALLGLMALGAVFTVFGFPYQTLMPTFADQVLHVGSQGLGYLMATTGAGALISSIVFARWGTSQMTLFVVGSGLGVGIAIVLFALSPVFSLSLVLALLAGTVFSLFFTSTFAATQVIIPPHMRGRVLGIRFLIFGSSPLGQLFVGALAEQIGTPYAVAAMGALCTVLMAAVLFAFPSLRRLEAAQAGEPNPPKPVLADI